MPNETDPIVIVGGGIAGLATAAYLARSGRSAVVLERFLQCFVKADAKAMEALLAEDVQSVHDAGGEFIAAGIPVLGRQKVALFYSNIAPPENETLSIRFVTLNGLPGVLAERPSARPGTPRRWAYLIQLDQEGRIERSWAVFASRKLAAVTFDRPEQVESTP